jgi:hypothetical protein
VLDEEKSDSKFIFLFEMVVSEKRTVLQLKFQIYDFLVSENNNKVLNKLPDSPNHIRIRDLKGGKMSAPMRDDRLLCRCFLGLADGRKIFIEILDQKEIIHTDDLIISVRTISYLKKAILPPVEMPINRSTTLKSFLSILADQFSVTQEDLDHFQSFQLISIAKGFLTGPPLTFASAQKLKWMTFQQPNLGYFLLISEIPKTKIELF